MNLEPPKKKIKPKKHDYEYEPEKHDYEYEPEEEYKWCLAFSLLNDDNPIVYCTSGDNSVILILYDSKADIKYKVLKWAKDNTNKRKATSEYEAYVKVSQMDEKCRNRFARIYNLNDDFAKKTQKLNLKKILKHYLSNHSSRDKWDNKRINRLFNRIKLQMNNSPKAIPSEYGSGGRNVLSRVFELEMYRGNMDGKEEEVFQEFKKKVNAECIEPYELSGIEVTGRNIFRKHNRKMVVGDLDTI